MAEQDWQGYEPVAYLAHDQTTCEINEWYMRIDRLTVRSFKGFRNREFLLHPQFNLVAGINGTGKTSLLDALSVAAGSWLLGLRGMKHREISRDDVRLEVFGLTKGRSSDARWEAQYPCSVEASGVVQGKKLTWARQLKGPSARTTQIESKPIQELSAAADRLLRAGKDTLLPLIGYYRTGRLWNAPKEDARIRDEAFLRRKEETSRVAGYLHCLDPRLSVADLVHWIARQQWITFQKGAEQPAFRTVRRALIGCIDSAENLWFDPKFGEVVIAINGQGVQPFNNLSDGQRCMLALVGDIAQRAVRLNPHLGGTALKKTPGIVLIDELDLHLHPKWQRRVVEDLRRTFPQIQFVASTHSPFLIQSLRSGEELIVLDGEPTANLGNMGLEEIARGIMGVSNPQVSHRYQSMKEAARYYLEILEEASESPEKKLADYKEQLARSVGPFADNPAFQAFLEMKRAAKSGE